MSATQRGVTADPRKAAAERAQKRTSEWAAQKAAAIQLAKDVRKTRLQRAAEVETCYRQHTPRQVFHADEMIKCGDTSTVRGMFDLGLLTWDEFDMLTHQVTVDS